MIVSATWPLLASASALVLAMFLNDRVGHGWISLRNEDCFRPSTVTRGQMAARLGNCLLPMRDGVIPGAGVLPMLSEARHLGRVAVLDMDVRGLATCQAVKEESSRVGS